MGTSKPNTLSVQQDLITTENIIFVETVERGAASTLQRLPWS